MKFLCCAYIFISLLCHTLSLILLTLFETIVLRRRVPCSSMQCSYTSWELKLHVVTQKGERRKVLLLIGRTKYYTPHQDPRTLHLVDIKMYRTKRRKRTEENCTKRICSCQPYWESPSLNYKTKYFEPISNSSSLVNTMNSVQETG